eukprot:TRINITY_DN758_c0_g5_i1.p1 TRINITY_DN758_c0_g5~~TRINITY_DN758_c0_g5_i1.p1  ORF type:complete len:155 (-),score=34.56 TRINITY_DN758_c0_g5_i1:105-569(-)
MEEAIGHKDLDKEQTVKTYSVIMLLLSIPTLNLVNLIGAGLCFLTLRKAYTFWKEHWRLLKSAYGASLAVTIIEAGGLFVLFLRLQSGLDSLTAEERASRAFHSEVSVVLLVLCVLAVFCVVKTYKALLELYTEFERSPDVLLKSLTNDESNLK